MIDATLGSVVNDRPAGTAKLVVEPDAGSQSKEPGHDPYDQVSGDAGAVPLQVEQVLAGPEDRLDALADRSQMWSSLLLVDPRRADDARAQLFDPPGEIPAGVPLVADDGLPTFDGSRQEDERHLPLRSVGRSELDGARGAVRAAGEMQPTPPEIARVAAGIPIATDLGQRRASDGFERASAFDRGGIKEKDIITSSRTPRTEDPEEPLDGAGEPGPALVIGVLRGKHGKEMPDLAAGCPQKAPVRGNTHEDLGHRQSDDLGIRDPASRVPTRLWQKIIGCAINDLSLIHI